MALTFEPYAPGGRWELILRTLEADVLTLGPIIRAVDPPESGSLKARKRKVWRAISGLVEQRLIQHVGTGFTITVAGRDALMLSQAAQPR